MNKNVQRVANSLMAVGNSRKLWPTLIDASGRQGWLSLDHGHLPFKLPCVVVSELFLELYSSSSSVCSVLESSTSFAAASAFAPVESYGKMKKKHCD